jgi:hypothetical protein
MSAGLAEYEWEASPESGQEGEWETEAEAVNDIANWARSQWAAVQTPGSWQRNAALAAARSALASAGQGGAAAMLADRELEGEFESEFESESAGEYELNPARRIYLDAMMEHLAHEAAEAESEEEAAEGFLPLIPMIAGKLLPLAAKVLPKVAGKVMPNIARAVTRVTPRLSRGVNSLARTLYRNPRTRRLVRTIPSIARRTITRVARQAAAGRAVTPAAAQRVLAQQAYRVLARPQETVRVLRRNAAMDHRYHGATRIAGRPRSFRFCPTCGSRTGRSARTCSCHCSWSG